METSLYVSEVNRNHRLLLNVVNGDLFITYIDMENNQHTITPLNIKRVDAELFDNIIKCMKREDDEFDADAYNNYMNAIDTYYRTYGNQMGHVTRSRKGVINEW